MADFNKFSRRKFLQAGSLATLGAAFGGPGSARTPGSAATGSMPAAPLAGSAPAAALIADVPVLGLAELSRNFAAPPGSVRSSCYWWWFNGLVDKEGITRDLEEYHAKGMGEVLLVNSSDGLGGALFPQGARLFSEEWKQLYRHAMSEAKRLDIAVGINLCSGWCMGGPWIQPEDSGRWYLQSELEVEGPLLFSGHLPLPGNRAGYDKVFNPPGYKNYIDLPLEKLDYRDTAVVAIPAGKPGASGHSDGATGQAGSANDATGGSVAGGRISGPRALTLDAKTNHRDASNFIMAVDVMKPLLECWHNEPEDAPVQPQEVIDLSGKMDKDGRLDWQVPPGKWKIIRTGHRMTGSRLSIAQPEGDGLSVDWFNGRGVELQFEHLGKVFIDEAAKVGAKPKYFCDDSFEDGFPNWTGNILEQFKKYRGYDATPYLPALSGYLIGGAAVSDRFLNDYRKTLGDCMADGHYQRFADLCHQHGMLVQNEAAGPSRSGTMCMDGLKNQGRSDLPMGEFWLGPHHEDESTLTDDKPYGTSRLDKGQNKVTKMAATAGHIYGHTIISAEAFTSFRHWLDYPGSLKQALDRAYCEGINRIAIHTSTATRPRDGKPGYEYGAGTHFNPNVTWWEMSKPFFDYVGRCQYLLRAGHFCADVLFYNGDVTPNLVAQKHADPSLGKGYDYDVCNEEIILTRLSCKNGKLTLPDGMSYEVLVLPDTTRMPLAVLQRIAQLVKEGATVVGPRPLEDSGLLNYPGCDEEIKQLTTRLWGPVDGSGSTQHRYGAGTMYQGTPVREILAQKNIHPDFEYTGGEEVWLDFIHRSTPEAEIYFITNRHGWAVRSDCSFRVTGTVPELWDPIDGTRREKVSYRVEGGRVQEGRVQGGLLVGGRKTDERVQAQRVEGDRQTAEGVQAQRVVVPLKFEAFQSWFVLFPKQGASKPGDGRQGAATDGRPGAVTHHPKAIDSLGALASSSAPGGPAVLDAPDNFPELQTIQELTGAWAVEFDPRWGGPAQVRFDSLQDWSTSDDPRIRYYSGKALYSKEFDYKAEPGNRPQQGQKTFQHPVVLHLGTVKNIARVHLNDKDLGVVWTAPWQVDLSPALVSGRNRLTIEVINLWPNRLIHDAGLPPEQRLTNTNIPIKKATPLLSSGLLGPVTLKKGR